MEEELTAIFYTNPTKKINLSLTRMVCMNEFLTIPILNCGNLRAELKLGLK